MSASAPAAAVVSVQRRGSLQSFPEETFLWRTVDLTLLMPSKRGREKSLMAKKFTTYSSS